MYSGSEQTGKRSQLLMHIFKQINSPHSLCFSLYRAWGTDAKLYLTSALNLGILQMKIMKHRT